MVIELKPSNKEKPKLGKRVELGWVLKPEVERLRLISKIKKYNYRQTAFLGETVLLRNKEFRRGLGVTCILVASRYILP